MEKTYDITDDMISNLHEGQEFKNFAELSRTLNILDSHGKPLSGNSKIQLLEELARYVVLKNNGRQIVIEKIRPEDEILPQRPEKGNRKYVDLIQRLLVCHFNALCEAVQCDGIKILWEKKDIWQTCGMISNGYRWYGRTDGTAEDAATADAFRKLVGGVKLNVWLENALNGLKKNDALVYEEKRAFVNYDGGNINIIPLTDAQNVQYMKLHAETLKDYTLTDGITPATERDLWATGRLNDFYSKLNIKLKKAFRSSDDDKPLMIQKVYEIIIEPTTMKLFSRRFGKIDPQDTDLAIQMMSQLNSLICDSLMSAISLDKEVKVATRVQNHEDVVKRIEQQKIWGVAQLTKKEKEARREFQYDTVSLTKEQKDKMINKTIRLSKEEIKGQVRRGLQMTSDSSDSNGCFIIEKIYIDGFLHGSGLTEEQYDKIMQEAEKEYENEKALEQLIKNPS